MAPTPNGERLLIRADASTKLGAGHAMRSFALAKAWQRTGGSVTFAMAESLPEMAQRFRNEGMEVHRLASEPGGKGDLKETASLACRLEAHWAVIDGYHFRPEYVRELHRSGVQVCAFDDDGRFAEYCADLVLNQNLGASGDLYPRRQLYTNLLLGTKYALLRPEFLQTERSREIPVLARRLLVSMGGADADNVTKLVMHALGELDCEMETTIVVGSGNQHYEQLLRIAERLPRVRLLRNPPDMAAFMRQSDLALSAAGSTCWELAYLGVPMVLIALANNQRGIATALAQRGAAINLGWQADLSPTQIARTINQLAPNVLQRRAMSEVGRSLVDGRGAERVVNAIRSYACQ